jgi:hypothetical protein
MSQPYPPERIPIDLLKQDPVIPPVNPDHSALLRTPNRLAIRRSIGAAVPSIQGPSPGNQIRSRGVVHHGIEVQFFRAQACELEFPMAGRRQDHGRSLDDPFLRAMRGRLENIRAPESLRARIDAMLAAERSRREPDDDWPR